MENQGLYLLKLDGLSNARSAWIKRCQSLVKNYERTLDRANTKIHLGFLRLMLKRLARA